MPGEAGGTEWTHGAFPLKLLPPLPQTARVGTKLDWYPRIYFELPTSQSHDGNLKIQGFLTCSGNILHGQGEETSEKETRRPRLGKPASAAHASRHELSPERFPQVDRHH
jgi:hypothetical protein